ETHSHRQVPLIINTTRYKFYVSVVAGRRTNVPSQGEMSTPVSLKQGCGPITQHGAIGSSSGDHTPCA
ncbi:hypothetical protein BaRGS_00000659, partial [Batillaria attramentaria]